MLHGFPLPYGFVWNRASQFQWYAITKMISWLPWIYHGLPWVYYGLPWFAASKMPFSGYTETFKRSRICCRTGDWQGICVESKTFWRTWINHYWILSSSIPGMKSSPQLSRWVFYHSLKRSSRSQIVGLIHEFGIIFWTVINSHELSNQITVHKLQSHQFFGLGCILFWYKLVLFFGLSNQNKIHPNSEPRTSGIIPGHFARCMHL